MRKAGKFLHPKFIRKNSQQCHVIAFSNQKGGTGKTVSTGLIGACIASEYHEEFRVGVIDADPQGTLSLIHAPDRHHEDLRNEIFGFGELIAGEYELEEGETMKDVVSKAFLQTTIPNLRILPAMDMDRQLEGNIHEKLLKGEIDNPYSMLSNLISHVKDEFDIILIDTPPAMNFSVYNSFYAATSLVIPVCPTEQDRDATMRWLQQLPIIFKTMVNVGMKDYDFIRFLITNHDGKDTANSITQEINNLFGVRVMDTALKSSEAIRVCAKDLNTIYDISKSEYPKASKKSFGNAITNGRSVTEQIVKLARDIWYQQDRK